MAGQPHPKPTPRRKAPKRMRASRGNTVPKATLTALDARAGWRCEARTPDCQGSPEVPHHRRLKAQGVDHSLENLLAVCGSTTTGCHGAIHRHHGWSVRHGFILSAGDDPELIVVGCSFDCDIDHRAALASSRLPGGNPK
jgi:hypothetical protein